MSASELMDARVENKVSEEAAIRRSVLSEAHERAGASMRERDGWLVPASYGVALSEYEAVRGGAGAGLFDLSSRGRVEVSGAEAAQFLNGMMTNDVAALADGAWMHAAFPNVQGRLVASARVLRHADVFLFDTEAATHATLLKTLERFTLAGDFRVRETTAETALISLQGARAAEIISAALGEEAARVERGRIAVVSRGEDHQPLLVIRATHTAEDGFDVFVGAAAPAAAVALWDALVGAGASPAGFDALEILRVEAGMPRYGVDASDANVVLEVVDEAEAVSYTKGCYVGQEIIARIHWRGHVAKKLTGLVFDRGVEPPAPGAAVKSLDGAREVGRLTSVVSSPRLERVVALGLVRHEHLAPGTELRVSDGEEFSLAARVAGLPLVRGGWYAGDAGVVGVDDREPRP
ncbi:MAG: aminomethyl transferase family protein [Acidobacteria bacterium]|nr:aminomethyl transferase family protein [Acidobacteriota bacterium]